ncbi:MAG: MBL fold metallo-hydrolase [Sphingomonas bacterium]
MALFLKIAGTAILFAVIAVCLAITIMPRFLDRVYYVGPATGHFDGERFFNPTADEDIFRPPSGAGGRFGMIWRYLTGNDGRPPWPKSVPVRQTKPAARVEGDRMIATWIGHATVLIQTQGLNILTDPIWSDKTGPLWFGPRRVTVPGVRFEDLPKIDLVLISHNHYDHLDVPTLKRLWERDRPRIVTSLGNDALIRKAGADSTALDWGQHVAIRPGVEVFVTRNHHWGSRWFTDRNRALWSSFVVRLPEGGNIFFAGDTGLGDGKWPAEAAAYGPIRFAMIPIGAFRFVPGQMESGSHVGPGNAIRIFDRLGAAKAIPIHWGTYRLSYEARDTPPKMLSALMHCTGGEAGSFAPAEIGAPIEVAPYAPLAKRPDEGLIAQCLQRPDIRALD